MVCPFTSFSFYLIRSWIKSSISQPYFPLWKVLKNPRIGDDFYFCWKVRFSVRQVVINMQHLGSIMLVIECDLGRDASIGTLKKSSKIGPSHATHRLFIVAVCFTQRLSFRLRCFFSFFFAFYCSFSSASAKTRCTSRG